MIVTLNDQNDDGVEGVLGEDIGSDIEIVQTGDGNDNITGSAGSNGLFGGAGNDEINGGRAEPTCSPAETATTR